MGTVPIPNAKPSREARVLLLIEFHIFGMEYSQIRYLFKVIFIVER
jgi:hypothetical protein